MRVDTALLRLKAVVESDPGALVRVLQFFQMRNVVPHQVTAHRLGSDYLETEIAVDSEEVDRETFRLITSKIERLPMVVAAVICE
jgi:hypothetical protein